MYLNDINYLFDHEFASLDVKSVHLLHGNFHSIGILKLDDSTTSGLVILVGEQFNVGNFAHFVSEQIFQILPSEIVWDVGNVNSTFGNLSVATIVSVAASVSALRVDSWPFGASVTVTLSASFFVVIVLLHRPENITFQSIFHVFSTKETCLKQTIFKYDTNIFKKYIFRFVCLFKLENLKNK